MKLLNRLKFVLDWKTYDYLLPPPKSKSDNSFKNGSIKMLYVATI